MGVMGVSLKLRLEDIINNGAAAGFYRGGSFVDGKSFSRLIKGLYEKASEHPSKRAILYCDDNYLFSGAFLALLSAGKTVIIPADYRSALAGELSTSLIFSDREGLSVSIASDTELPPINEDAELFFCKPGYCTKPTLVRKRFANLTAELTYLTTLFSKSLMKKPVFVSTVNTAYMYGTLYAFLLPLLNGLVIDTSTVRIPERLSAMCEKYKKVFLVSSPAFLDQAAQDKSRYSFAPYPVEISSSGSVLKNVSVIKELFGVWPMEIHGSTETGGVAYRKNMEKWTLFTPVNARTTDSGLAVSGGLLDEEYILPDIVEFVDKRHFILKGRWDRLVKIAGKWVSLPELEAKILSNEAVLSAHTILLKNEQEHIGAVLTLTPEGKQRLIEEGKQAFVASIKQMLATGTEPAAVPAKWRILEELPIDLQGKILTAEVEREFTYNLPEPVVLKKTLSHNEAALDLVFIKDAAYFRGHIPDSSVLPGVAQVHFAIYWARKYFSDSLQPVSISRLKFSNVLTPSEKCTLSLAWVGNQINFSYHNGGKIYSSGELHV